ncbi:MAG: sporulation transcription factor Spo0A [Lachnospiraceae bacterium]
MNNNLILITDENRTYLKGIDLLLAANGYNTLWVKGNGTEVMKQAERMQPKAILMSTFMPGIDGLGVLKMLKSQTEPSPACFLCGTFDSPHIVQRMMECGAEYYFYLPMEVKLIADRIIELLGNDSSEIKPSLSIHSMDNFNKNNSDIETVLTNYMHQLGIPAHIKGYQYLRIGIILALNDRSLLEAVTKELYPEIAKKTNSTASRVERAIRHAIEVAWNRGDIKAQEHIFGYTINTLKGKPTNSEFIAMMVDTLYERYTRAAS